MVRINLALQGGGAHGAFTWGVLDVLLQDPEIEIAAISGTSAGALNGAALKAGMLEGGRGAARANLDWLWKQMGALSGPAITQWMGHWTAGALAKTLEYSVPFMMADFASRMVSPYAYGPFYSHPLEGIAKAFHFDSVCADNGPRLFICATNVRTGKARVFMRDEICSDVLLASACLPTLFQAVEIDDPKTGKREAFWDGGYTGNPALWPFFAPDLPDDVLIVNINPIERDTAPVTPQQIQSRMNEISFNSSLMSELRAISFAKRLLKQGAIKEGDMKDVNIHMIADDDLMNDLSVATKMVPVPAVLAKLKSAGQAAAHGFLKDHRAKLGTESSIDITSMYG